MVNTAFNGSDLLAGVKVLEFSAIGPVPWGVSLMVDLGATVTRICRPEATQPAAQPTIPSDAMAERGRHNVYLDLKNQADRAQALELVHQHDVLIEGMRPGVMERLGLAPAECAKVHPALVYARVTGWGQDGPLALTAGHDINYISLSGALHAIGHKDGPPVIPLNLVGDYGGGGAFMLIGILSGLLKARATGKGSVLDIAMIDGAARQMGLAYERLGTGQWVDERGSNMLDGGSPWYSVYQTRCGEFMAVGAIEQQFYDQLLVGLELDPGTLPDRHDKTRWEHLRGIFTEQFLTRTRAEWTAIFESKDACVTPVLSLREAPQHPHNQARNAYVTGLNGAKLPACAPRSTSF